MHAVVVHVTIEAGRIADAERELNEAIVPMIKESKGFVSGIWTHSTDGTRGVGIVAFSSEEDARASVDGMNSMGMPPESPVTIDSAEVYDIGATA
jgi:hypothetical protein